VPAYQSYQNFFEKTQVGYGASIATVMTVVVIIVTALFLRQQGRAEREDQ
jgi:raffinose/stachyose/melibiose transport system permease protein